jgi:hypothetical protein
MEPIAIVIVLSSAVGSLAFRHVYKITQVGTFLYLYAALISLLVAACAYAISLSPMMDIGIAASGISMAVASGWLAYTFRLAGERVD